MVTKQRKLVGAHSTTQDHERTCLGIECFEACLDLDKRWQAEHDAIRNQNAIGIERAVYFYSDIECQCGDGAVDI